MRRNILIKITALFAVVLLFSCKAKKEAAKSAAKSTGAAAFSKEDVLNNIRKKQLDFRTMSLKAKAGLTIDGKSNDVSMNIRIRKDEAIWVSVTVIAGIEVARALITPDSVKIINRIQSEYMAQPFDLIHQYTNEQVNFKTLQSILIGNCVPGFVSEKSDLTLADKKPVLSGIIQALAYTFSFNEDNKVTQTHLEDQDAGQKLTASYSDFTLISGAEIPQNVTIQSTANNKDVNLKLNYNQISINEPLEFPFSVPKRFTQQD